MYCIVTPYLTVCNLFCPCIMVSFSIEMFSSSYCFDFFFVEWRAQISAVVVVGTAMATGLLRKEPSKPDPYTSVSDLAEASKQACVLMSLCFLYLYIWEVFQGDLRVQVF